MNNGMNKTLKRARIAAVAVIGTTAVLIGIAMLVLPGPGVIVIIGGLALLGTEFVWARRLMRKVKRAARNIKEGMQGARGNGGEDRKDSSGAGTGPASSDKIERSRKKDAR